MHLFSFSDLELAQMTLILIHDPPPPQIRSNHRVMKKLWTGHDFSDTQTNIETDKQVIPIYTTNFVFGVLTYDMK